MCLRKVPTGCCFLGRFCDEVPGESARDLVPMVSAAILFVNPARAHHRGQTSRSLDTVTVPGFPAPVERRVTPWGY